MPLTQIFLHSPIKVESAKVSDIKFSTTPAYPDYSKPYMLNYRSSLLGKNTLAVSVTSAGLLTSTKSTSVSQVTDTLKSLASSAASLTSFNLIKSRGLFPAPENKCTTDGDYIFTYNFSETSSFVPCGIPVSIKRLSQTALLTKNNETDTNDDDNSYSGIFYRQNIPYKVSATAGGRNYASVLFSPSGSKTKLLPISRTFFANNEADFDFVDGTPTKYNQDTDGEAIALLKLPADIISAYFSAVGSVFESFNSQSSNEKAALSNEISLELAKKQYKACLKAIKADDKELIQSLECE